MNRANQADKSNIMDLNYISTSKQNPKKVLMVLSSIGINGGVQNKLMDIYRNINREKIQFEFFVYTNSDESFESEINSLGGNVFFYGRIREAGAVTFYKNLFHRIKEGEYDIVHSYVGINDALVLLLARLAGVKIRISHSRGASINNKVKRRMFPILKRLIITNSTQLLACSTQAGDFLYGKKQYQVIPNPINIDKFSRFNSKNIENLRKKIGLNEETLILGHIGRFSIEKNHIFLLKLGKILKDKNVNYKMIFVGDGELKNEIQMKAIELGIQDFVYMAGSQNNVEDYYHLFDLLLFPSLHEGFGNVAVEAQASNTRVIASKGVSRQVDIGLNLIEFLNLEDVNCWIKEILEAQRQDQKISSDDIREALNSRGFGIESIVNQYHKIYEI